MHTKASEVLDQEIQFMGPVSPSESKNAQHKILGIYFNLAKSNVIGPLPEAT
jgi:flagellar motor switch protein FliG